MSDKEDLTADKNFKKVVGHFLATKPKTQKEVADQKREGKRKDAPPPATKASKPR